MGGSLNQPRRVKEEGAQHCKLLLSGKKKHLRVELTVLDE
jgi:hypothetical protein